MFPRVDARNCRKVQCCWCPHFFSPIKSSPRGPHCRVPTFLTWTKRPLVQSMYWIVPLLGISCPAWGTLYYFLLWAREVRVKSVLSECWFHGQVILVDDRYVIVYRHFVVFAVGTKHVHAYTILKSLYVPFLYFCFFSSMRGLPSTFKLLLWSKTVGCKCWGSKQQRWWIPENSQSNHTNN